MTDTMKDREQPAPRVEVGIPSGVIDKVLNNAPMSRREFGDLVRAAALGLGSLAFLDACGKVGLVPRTATPGATLTKVSTATATQEPTDTATATQTATATETKTSPIVDRLKLTVEQQNFLIQHPINSVDASRNMFAITIDDFPITPDQLKTILDALKGRARATFFPIGHNLAWLAKGEARGWQNTDLIKRIVDEGHEIGCHTFTHGDTPLTAMKPSQLDKEFSLWLEAMDSIIPNYQPAFFRALGGAYDDEVLKVGAKYGMQHALWNCESGGMDKATLNRVLDEAKPGGLLLCHMMRPYDVADMGQIVTNLVGRGLVLATLSEAIIPAQKLSF
ncbi:MAG: polysaccharide deacetylase family protein [Candidatus Microgenomates bacterium]|jgi:peptidoglycan/xylan/chitin deacetylase (PgdA/CDA1 family)